MKNLIVLFALSIVVALSNCSDKGNSAEQKEKNHKKAEKMEKIKADWLSFDEGLSRAKKEKKNMLVDFYTDWCHWCKVMDEKTFHDDKVKNKLVERFITVRLNAEDKSKTATYKGVTYTNIELTKAFGVTGFPSLAFLDPQGEIITIVPGYIPPETFIYILEYIDQECYKKQMPFEEFMKKQGKCEETKPK